MAWYKVLFRDIDDSLFSVWVRGSLLLYYAPGKKTIGKRGPILFFDSYENAKDFRDRVSQYQTIGKSEIWFCEPDSNPFPVRNVLAYSIGELTRPRVDIVKKFWDSPAWQVERESLKIEGIDWKNVSSAPPGTYAARAVTLLEPILEEQ